MLVLRGRPVAHRTALWYAVARVHRVVSFPVHHAGEAHSIFGRIRVRMRCRAICVLRPLGRCRRKRSEPRAALPVDAARRACWVKVSDSSMLMPRYLMLRVGVIIWSLIESWGSVDNSTILWWLALGR
jgi:hypothetical protein